MEWSEHGIVIGTRRHGENDTILEVVTRERGRHLGLVRGGRSRRLRPILQPGNVLALTWRARLDEHLGNFSAEPVVEHSSGLVATRAGAYGLALAAAHLRLLPERDPHPRLYAAFASMLDELGGPERAGEVMVRFELLLLDELGFGLDLESCAVTGTKEDLVAVSPKSGRSISAAEAAPFAGKLLALPAFLLRSGPASWADIIEGLLLTGHFLTRDVLTDRSAPLLLGRERLVDRLRRAAGLA
jgi:DNA repair protein RecO (recombination protein O)